MVEKYNCHVVVNKDTGSIVYMGSLDNCAIKAGQYNAMYDCQRFVVREHQSGSYVDKLIGKTSNRRNYSMEKKNGVIHLLMSKHNTPPVLIPEPTAKERVQDYLKKIKK